MNEEYVVRNFLIFKRTARKNSKSIREFYDNLLSSKKYFFNQSKCWRSLFGRHSKTILQYFLNMYSQYNFLNFDKIVSFFEVPCNSIYFCFVRYLSRNKQATSKRQNSFLDGKIYDISSYFLVNIALIRKMLSYTHKKSRTVLLKVNYI